MNEATKMQKTVIESVHSPLDNDVEVKKEAVSAANDSFQKGVWMECMIKKTPKGFTFWVPAGAFSKADEQYKREKVQ